MLSPQVVLSLLGLRALSQPDSMWRLSCDVDGRLGRQGRDCSRVLLLGLGQPPFLLLPLLLLREMLLLGQLLVVRAIVLSPLGVLACYSLLVQRPALGDGQELRLRGGVGHDLMVLRGVWQGLPLLSRCLYASAGCW